MTHVDELLRLCRKLTELELVSGKGGNCSVKSGDRIAITASGEKIQDTTFRCDCCEGSWALPDIKDEAEYFAIGAALFKGSGEARPSMEYGIHCLPPCKYVVHLHLTELNTILCSEEALKIVTQLFHNITTFYFVRYITPGFSLFQRLKENPLIWQRGIFFLENHGLIVCGDTEDQVFERIRFIQSVVAGYLNPPLYPDAACLPAENFEANREILSGIRRLGLTPKFLTPSEIEELKNLDYEKHRAQAAGL